MIWNIETDENKLQYMREINKDIRRRTIYPPPLDNVWGFRNM